MHSDPVSRAPDEILLVEDNPADAHLIRIALDECDTRCTLHTVSDGTEAIRFLYDTEQDIAPLPAFVLLDLNLPLMTGHEVLEHIRSHSTTQTLPVIIMSSSRSPNDVIRAYRSGANCYLHKPQDFDELIEVMRLVTQFWLQTVRLPDYNRHNKF